MLYRAIILVSNAVKVIDITNWNQMEREKAALTMALTWVICSFSSAIPLYDLNNSWRGSPSLGSLGSQKVRAISAAESDAACVGSGLPFGSVIVKVG